MKKWIGFSLVIVVLLIFACQSQSRSDIVAGSEQVYYGTLSDRGMHLAQLKEYYMPWEKARPYVGVAFGEGGDCFFLAKGYELPEELELGDAIAVEVATERWTNLTIATRVEKTIIS